MRSIEGSLSGARILIKRDDHTGLALGGNKVRKLEFLCGEALRQGCDTLITAGAIQSNHCRQTAGAAASLGLRCHLLLGGSAPKEWNGNLLLDRILGAEVHWAGDKRKGEELQDLSNELKKQGRKPYIIPYGGSNSTGALGYVNAAVEILSQLETIHEKVEAVVLASSSGATQAGLIVGSAMVGCTSRILGVRIDKEEAQGITFADSVKALVSDTARLCEISNAGQHPIELADGYLGDGYGVVGDLERETIKLLAQTEGILLDPVYTGRAFGGLIDMVRNKLFRPTDTVLFLHTGGAPAIFPYSNQLLP